MLKNFSLKFLFWTCFLSISCTSLNKKQIMVRQGEKLEFRYSSGHELPVLFESGLGGHVEWWAKIIPEIAKTNSVFSYNRPGIGGSDVTKRSRDALQIIEDLRQTLQNLEIKPPYILVGHSTGGLYLQLFARKYPSEVAGLVLVDSTHPLQMRGPGAPDRWSWWLKLYMKVFLSETGERELSAVNESGDQVLSYTNEGLKFPIQILTATEPKIGRNEYERDLIDKRNNLAQLYPNAKQVFVPGGHAIPIESPQAVITAIKEILSSR